MTQAQAKQGRDSEGPVKDAPSPIVYRFHHTVDVRFRDLDSMGHAHHTLPLVYLEEARAAYWRDVAGREADRIDYVMAGITIRFHKRIRWPGRLDVAVRVSRLGGKSFDMAFEIRDGQGDVVASGTTTQVAYDYAAERTMALDTETRRRIEEFEGIGGA
jgi:acyl-CoA thioester hydrolase